MNKEIEKNLQELDFRPNEIKVYLALTKLGEARASIIAKKADLPRTTTISILDKLYEENFLTLHQYKGVRYYWIESPQVISEIFKNKMNYAKDLSLILGDLYHSDSSFPTARVIDTKNGIKNYIEKTILSLEKKSIIYTMDTPNIGNYEKVFSESIIRNLNLLKKKKQIQTKTLVPHNTLKDIKTEKLTTQNIEIRELPKEINFFSSMWIINNSLVHFSAFPLFLTVINHKKITEGIKNIYNFLWNISNIRH
ncbi:hypothetical protein A2331_03145 [Candidatus Falkowbacteria bacterium RIFOXYB2_FULL_34_18]|uniref:Transcription regulator TrmB N-terminal domain-containing protein n=1 Tax=Candidatus Falkowbacteria bacterium RIFOXYD2_FULL_34_120 TaxID=1798007 RepID=A0A1F5TN50_9BACT|nr:MAG: hypothetical protein A2500_00115 [Candidatus Falkowbacteria bacterium RIFOXYC12_FULL_34_55]OGF28628.1 MAG: hypothetical protein A2331_03145 [Candidatus Falkowbacteria bacterium RIFOXYB2_FULL_34_18]OGF38190.1 MAG: hypothetical protein A2466_00040 [Candidatus Falkowbacteria bacterium RIFOXYC2_FULL_34_220]OGF38300.1 MAG: hypothetical protein A2515_00785 [Candidatus Falkowbacteria bacterium RIFOXYD12_FULL_34_57]OGF40277.1 MAG: hypothetical protein A2531_04570 [Candidatus Falkowbacteria bact